MSLKQKHLIFWCISAVVSFVLFSIAIWNSPQIGFGMKCALQGLEVALYCVGVPAGPWEIN